MTSEYMNFFFEYVKQVRPRKTRGSVSGLLYVSIPRTEYLVSAFLFRIPTAIFFNQLPDYV